MGAGLPGLQSPQVQVKAEPHCDGWLPVGVQAMCILEHHQKLPLQARPRLQVTNGTAVQSLDLRRQYPLARAQGIFPSQGMWCFRSSFHR